MPVTGSIMTMPGLPKRPAALSIDVDDRGRVTGLRYLGLGTRLAVDVGGTELVAVERDPQRARRLDATLARLGLHATTLVADAAEPGTWWDGRPFQRILLDAPCSATGVIRRHPDIKTRRSTAQIAALASGQHRLLQGLWPLLAPGGVLLYATCSVFPEENEEPLIRFLAVHAEAQLVPLDAPWGRARTAGRQILPGDDGMDGFFYALVRRRG